MSGKFSGFFLAFRGGIGYNESIARRWLQRSAVRTGRCTCLFARQVFQTLWFEAPFFLSKTTENKT